MVLLVPLSVRPVTPPVTLESAVLARVTAGGKTNARLLCMLHTAAHKLTLVLEGAHRLPNLCADEHQPITDAD